MRYLTGILLALFATLAVADGSTRRIGVVDEYAITSFPLYGAEVVQSDTVPLATPGFIRANEPAQVTVVCQGNASDATITLDLAAGEFVPCLVSYVYDSDTDDVDLHVFY